MRNFIFKTVFKLYILQVPKIFVLCVIFLSSATLAHSAQKSQAASECSAIFFIMTSIESDIPKLGKHFTGLGNLADLATTVYMMEGSSSKVTRGMVSRKKSAEIRRVGELSNRKFQTILESCMGWVNALGKKISKGNKSKSAMKNAIVRGPSPTVNYDYPYPDGSWIESAVKKSIRLWKLNGRITPDKVREALKMK